MSSQISTARRLGTLGMTTMVFSLLGGCAGDAPPRVDETQVKQFAGRGYLSDERFSIATTFSIRDVGEHSFALAWTAPVAGNSLPVVVYLPGLGESRTAGESWRTAWAQAGYAVLSVQLLDEDQKAWSSDAARGGDFALLARERYAGRTAAARLNALAALMAALGKDQANDAGLLRRLDLSHVAVAGFDVGAYTAMLVAGEMPKDSAAPVRLPISPKAIVALSPYADFSGTALSSRYRSITVPVLSVSGDADSDTAGIVSSPSLRKAPFEYMPSRDAYLLWLANATHAVFSGSALRAAEDHQETGAPHGGDSQGSRAGASRRRGRGERSEPAGAADANGDNGALRGGRLGAPSFSPTDRAISVSLVQSITTAFLDAYMKQDPIAQEWLQKNARRWIGDRGEWKRK